MNPVRDWPDSKKKNVIQTAKYFDSRGRQLRRYLIAFQMSWKGSNNLGPMDGAVLMAMPRQSSLVNPGDLSALNTHTHVPVFASIALST